MSKTLIDILNLKETRIQNVCKKHWLKGEPIKENQGGDTRPIKYETKINNFMSTVKVLENKTTAGVSQKDNILVASLNNFITLFLKTWMSS